MQVLFNNFNLMNLIKTKNKNNQLISQLVIKQLAFPKMVIDYYLRNVINQSIFKIFTSLIPFSYLLAIQNLLQLQISNLRLENSQMKMVSKQHNDQIISEQQLKFKQLSPCRKFLKFLENLEENSHYLIIIAIHMTRLLSVVLHLIFACLLLQQEISTSYICQLITNLYQFQNLYRALQVIIYLSKFVQLAALLVVIGNYCQGIIYKISLKIVKYIIIISEVDLMFTGIFLFVNLKENIIALIIASIISLAANITIENYTNRRALSYVTSQVGSILGKGIQIFIILGNSIATAIGDIFYFFIINFAAGIIIFKWYKDVGINLYIHQSPKILTMVSISLYFTFILIIFSSLHENHDIFTTTNILKCMLLLSGIFALWNLQDYTSSLDFKQFQNPSFQKSHIKNIDLKSFTLLTNSANCQDIDCLFIGNFRLHRERGCTNSKCYIHYESYYDSYLKQKESTSQGNKEKQSLLRFYIKCLYERAIQKSNGRNIGLLLDCCQYYISESFDLFKICRIFRETEGHRLNIFETVRLERLKIAANQQGKRINKLTFDGKMEFELMLSAEDTFLQIGKSIEEYLLRSYEIWTQIEKSEVNLTHLRTKINNNFTTLSTIKEKWGKITNYLTHQQKWRIYHINYSLFILNERIRQKDLQDFEQSLQELPSKQKIFDQRGSEEQLYDTQLLFDQNSMFLHATIQNQKLILLKASKNFQIASGYQEKELWGGDLAEILCQDIKEKHDKVVISWLQQGESNNQALYKARFTEIKTKTNVIIPVIKYFKVIVNVQSRHNHYLHFACMLRINTKGSDFFALQSSKGVDQKGLMTSSIVNNQFLEKQSKKAMCIENNPFIKQQNLRPKNNTQGLSLIKRTIRFLIIFLILMNVALSFLISYNSATLTQQIDQYMNILNLYRYPFAFGKSAIKVGMNIGNQVKAANQISYCIAQLQALMSDQMTTEALFSTNINPINTYYPFRNDLVNEGIGYNQIDLVYFMMSNMETLKLLPIDLRSESFVNFDTYVAPGLDSLLNTTKNNFHKQFSSFFTSMKRNQLIIVYVETLISLLVIGYIGYTIRQYFRKMKANLQIIVDFNPIQIKKIQNYWRNLFFFCQEINESQNQNKRTGLSFNSQIRLSNRFSGSDDNENNQQANISLNKKSKKIKESKNQTRRVIKIISFVLICMLVCFGSGIVMQLINVSNLTQLSLFEQAGFAFIQYFPATSILSYAVQKRYYYQMNPQLPPFDGKRFEHSLSDIELIGKSNYIGDVSFPNSQYFQDQKSYLFGNPCIANPLPLNGTDQNVGKCLSIYNSTFSQGITTFLRACKPQVESLIYGQINLTSSQVNEIANGLNLASAYITDAIFTWSDQFSDMINNLDDGTSLLCTLVSICLVLVYITLGEWFLLPKLTEDYAFMRKAFDYMIPESILINEKVIKQKFIINQMLDSE